MTEPTAEGETNLIDRHVMPVAWMAPRARFYETRMMAVDNCEQLVTPLYALTLEQVAVLEKHATAIAAGRARLEDKP